MSALPSTKDDSQSQESQGTQPFSSPQDIMSQSVWGTLLPNSDAMDQTVYDLRGWIYLFYMYKYNLLMSFVVFVVI